MKRARSASLHPPETLIKQPSPSTDLLLSGLLAGLVIEDARDRVKTSIVHRRGQSEFRQKLLAAYQGRCAITGYDAEHALEAAHIHPYRGEHTNHVQNGILLRADIHTLFDLGLVGIEPDTGEVIIRPELNGTQYAQLAGRKVHMPQDVDDRPSSELLRMHWQHVRDNSW